MPGVSGSAVVFAPSVLLTVTVEDGPDGDEIHLHAGGQGWWIARMVAELGPTTTLVGPFGGESGSVLSGLVSSGPVRLHATTAAGANGTYVHDRRSGDREVVADVAPARLTRHEVDELFGAALVDGLEHDVTVLAGPGLTPPVPDDLYSRLAHDLRANGRTVVADLSGRTLDCALSGGVTVLKVSAEELEREGHAEGQSMRQVVGAMERLRADGADNVVVTLAGDGLVGILDDVPVRVTSPAVSAVEHRGAGDSFTAGVAAALARGEDLRDAVRLATAAGALNVTRRGLGTGARHEIERLATQIEVKPLLQGVGR